MNKLFSIVLVILSLNAFSSVTKPLISCDLEILKSSDKVSRTGMPIGASFDEQYFIATDYEPSLSEQYLTLEQLKEVTYNSKERVYYDKEGNIVKRNYLSFPVDKAHFTLYAFDKKTSPAQALELGNYSMLQKASYGEFDNEDSFIEVRAVTFQNHRAVASGLVTLTRKNHKMVSVESRRPEVSLNTLNFVKRDKELEQLHEQGSISDEEKYVQWRKAFLKLVNLNKAFPVQGLNMNCSY